MISNSNGDRYVGLSSAAELVGVSTVTVHNYLTQGLVSYRKNIKGIRSINVPSLCDAFGIDPPEEPEESVEKKIGIYIRVSSQDYDFGKATDKSQLSIEFSTADGLSGTISSTGTDCDELLHVYADRFKPNIYKPEE